MTTDNARATHGQPWRDPIILLLIVIYVAIEGLLWVGDLGLFDTPRFRSQVYENAGFWPGLLDNWQPNYPWQPALMFVTYGFLHSGVMHLVVNMITLVSLAPVVIQRTGRWKFVVIYLLSILGGAVGFALLNSSYRPMVGASGALFGLAGAILAWEYVDRFAGRNRMWPVIRALALLVVLNIVLYVAMDRLLAWEAHLGGFVFGWIAAMLVDPTSRKIEP
jgi:membrane associated rhomboid family serine protease